MEEVLLQLDHIIKSFGSTLVLNNISLSIKKGEFITLLGSSGCGKTTMLRIIAGLETPDSGRVYLQGIDVTEAEPNRRDVNMVFQNYALFPHMTVEGNIGYSLKLKKMPKEKIKHTVKEALELVQLEGYEKRMPGELSGGQRQRVAIARAVVNHPHVLLLDEPLGALDLQLRRQLQMELKQLQKKLGITFIYITHDQEEALNMSDRIGVMKDGVFEQIGTPEEVYDRPKTSYVAKFVGESNIICGSVHSIEDGRFTMSAAGGYGMVTLQPEQAIGLTVGNPVTVAIRREQIEFSDKKKGIKAMVKEKRFAGGMLQITLELADGTEVVASRHGIDSKAASGDVLYIIWKEENAVLVDRNAEVAP